MTPADLDQDPEELNLRRLIAWAREEADALESVLPAVTEAQWKMPPTERPRVDTSERALNSHTDPTADIATDPDRLALRAQVVRSGRVLREAVVALRGVRLGIEHSLTHWTGH